MMSTLTCFFILALICFNLALFPYAASTAFNFTNITPQDSQEIVYSHDASYTPDDGIQVTYNISSDGDSEWSTGRATYHSPLHLWDNNTNDLASFSTSFTFVVNSDRYADGFSFFLAQNNSVVNSGGSIGLPFNITTNSSIYPFVAIEFDTFGDSEWDPKRPGTNISMGDHVGININSLTSVVSRKWYRNITYGKEYCSARVEYSSHSQNLSVSFTSFKDNLVVWETGLDFTINLREVLPEWVIYGFSASTEDRYENNSVISWSFNSTKLKDNETSNLVPTRVGNAVKREKITSHKVGLIVGTFVSVTVFVFVLAILSYCLWRKKISKDKVTELELSMETNSYLEVGPCVPRRFSYHELARSTSNFAETEKLGEGGFGGVYKGFLKDISIYVAVKRVSKTSKQGIKEYASEVRIISRLKHKNLLQLIGWCHEKGELLLAYEFMENGSLDLHLFKGRSLLTWHTRYKIALDLACALLYLHEEWQQCVLHRDIKSSNVMLDSNFNAKLGDFGLAKLVDHEKGSLTTMLAGTLGYMAPECIVTGRATKESDVFSFGVVALEIACGRKPIDYKAQEKQTRLIEWVWGLHGTETLLEAVDPNLGSEFEEEEMKRLMIVGLWCVHPDIESRPSMKEVTKVLNFEAFLPLLPSKMPLASYLAPQVTSLSDFTSTSQLDTSSDTS